MKGGGKMIKLTQYELEAINDALLQIELRTENKDKNWYYQDLLPELRQKIVDKRNKIVDKIN